MRPSDYEIVSVQNIWAIHINIYNTNNKKPYIIINISYKFWQDYIFGRVSDSHRQSFCKENMVAGEWGTVNLVRVQTSNAST